MSFFSFSCFIEVHTRCYKLEVFYINICGLSSARRKYATLRCSFYLHYAENTGAIAAPHRGDTDIVTDGKVVSRRHDVADDVIADGTSLVVVVACP